MCVSAAVWRDGKPVEWADSISELEAILGGPLVMDEVGYDSDMIAQIRAEGNHCLCPMDAKATAERYGLRCWPPAYGPRCWHDDAWGFKAPTIKARRPPKECIADHMKGEIADLSPSST